MLAWAEADLDVATLELDASARHLFVWDGAPTPGRIRSPMCQADPVRLQSPLSGC